MSQDKYKATKQNNQKNVLDKSVRLRYKAEFYR